MLVLWSGWIEERSSRWALGLRIPFCCLESSKKLKEIVATKKQHKKPFVLAIRDTTLLEPRIQRIAAALHSADFDMAVLLWDRGDLGDVPLVENVKSCSVRRFRFRAPSGTSSLIFFLPQWWIAVLLTILASKPRVIHVCDFLSAIPAVAAGKILGSKIVYDIFDFYSQMTIDEKPMNRILHYLITSLEHSIIRLADIAIVPHEHQLFLIGTARPKVGIASIDHSAESCEEKMPPSSRGFENNGCMTVLYNGYLEKGRGLYKLITAFEKIDNARLVISGYGREDRTLKKLNGHPRNFTYLGFLSRQKQLQCMKEADVMAILYDPKIPVYKVASPSKLYEAMIFAKPVIVSEGTVAAKIVREEKCGLVVNYEDIQELQQSITFLAENNLAQKEFAHNARQAYERKYNWDRNKQQIIKLYKNLTEHPAKNRAS